nr:hypothetical protein [Tanacetum cinerariifolium]
MELYMQNREHKRMIFESVENGPLIWFTIEENGVTRTKKYAELSAAEKIQADCNLKATNIILQDFVVPVFSLGDDPIACLNKAMAFITTIASSRYPSTNNQLRTSSNTRNQANIQDGRVTMKQVQGRQGKSYFGTGFKSNAASTGETMDSDGQAVQTIIPNNATFQTKDLNTYDSDCDDISNAKAVLMANISNYGSDVISEAPHSETHLNDMENQKQMINHINNWEKANKEHNNESVTAELERYKERVKTFEQRLNIDLSSREKMIDSQMDDMIKEKFALKEQVDSFEQNLSK